MTILSSVFVFKECSLFKVAHEMKHVINFTCLKHSNASLPESLYKNLIIDCLFYLLHRRRAVF